ncbi:MAG TPA: DivIVA domain-containing protein, partial [Longimicrobiales bacterium]|nr:DivIVA domain-containing protein [Longimicrobiales bacterium]
MIELTPLEIRQKKNDFRRVMRGYDPAAVDDFLETVAAHLEVVVRERMRLADEVEKASQLVVEYRERERALTEALVTAQEMREVVRTQSEKEAALIRREAEAEAERIRDEARRRLKAEEQAYEQLRGRRLELIRTYRRFLEREMNELSALEHTLELETRTEPVVAPVAVPWVQEVPAPTPEGPGSVADDSIEAANESA